MHVATLHAAVASLVCPQSKKKLELHTLAAAEAKVGRRLRSREELPNAKNVPSKPVGVTAWVLLREDLACAYPIADGVPVLLVPEMLTPDDAPLTVDLREPTYAETYEEMEFYNDVARAEAERVTASVSFGILRPLLGATEEDKRSFPHPKELWLDAVYDAASQWDCYSHLAPVRDRRVLQLGGKGMHAVKFLIAGAAEAWAVTPMLGEALCAQALAQAAGVSERLRCVVAVAEELPLAGASVDGIYAGGCLHHMQTELAFAECTRVLSRGGRLAAADPWRAPLHGLGTRILGKREPSVYCRPLTTARIAPARRVFRDVRIVQHGAITRYPLLALEKFGVKTSLQFAWALNQLDDSVSSFVPGLRGLGSSVAVLATK